MNWSKNDRELRNRPRFRTENLTTVEAKTKRMAMLRRKLADVPEHMLVKPQHVKSGMRWETDYNVAIWLRFKRIGQGSVQVYLHWHDDAGEHSISVDQSSITSDSILLSGIAHLKITGKVKGMSIAAESDSSIFTVDELFVQPARPSSAQKQA